MLGAVAGEDGYLFLGSDSNSSFDQYEGKYRLDSSKMRSIRAAHEGRSSILGEWGGRYAHIVVPNKETVLQHLVPTCYRYQRCGLTPYNLYEETERGRAYASFFRPNYLRMIHEEEMSFARLDTHWTHFGAISYLREALSCLGFVNEGDALRSLSLRRTTIHQAGDLGAKNGMDKEELVSISPLRKFEGRESDNQIGNDGRTRYFVNDNPSVNRKVLVHHDSTSEWLILVLRDLFRELLMVHYPDVDNGLLSVYKPDIFLFIQIERFFIRPVSNEARLAAIVADRERAKGGSNSALPILSGFGAY
jgi:hypothetical protein